jgi:tetratricopeptide (TPR) repeat protein
LQVTKHAQTAKSISTPRKRLFTLIALAIPVLFFVLLEFALRCLQYGPDLAIFTRETLAGKSYCTLNPACKNRYFNHSDFTPDPSPEHFLAAKPTGTLRIFCLGGSTTVGYPYWYNGAFTSFLRDRLQAVFPQRSFEIINLGMTATNSFTVLDIGRDLVRYQPDLLIVYDGHNEFYGALGIASRTRVAPARWMTLLYLRLVHLRTFQLLKNIISGALDWSGHAAKVNVSRTTLMEQVAEGQNVPYGSKMYRQALEIFQENLTDLAGLCEKHRIPLILATQVSNIKEQTPFISDYSSQTKQEQKAQFEKHFQNGLRLQAAGLPDSALVSFYSAIAIDSLFAEAHYRLGQCLYATGDKQRARTELVLARDYDELRFRGDSQLNQLIRAKQDGRFCFVADMEKLFQSLSQDSLIGMDVIFEHLHPRAWGQFLMAKEYSRIIQEHGLLTGSAGWAAGEKADDFTLWQNRHLTDVDEFMAERKIALLTSRWPFQKQAKEIPPVPPTDTLRTIADQAIHNRLGWITTHDLAAECYLRRRDAAHAAKEYETIINQLPLNSMAYLKLAKIHYDLQNFSKAETLLLASLQIEQTSVAYRVLGDIHLKQGQSDKAIRCYEALAKFPEDASTAADNAYMLALAYLVSENTRAAIPLLERTSARFPNYKPARDLLDRVKRIEATNSQR